MIHIATVTGHDMGAVRLWSIVVVVAPVTNQNSSMNQIRLPECTTACATFLREANPQDKRPWP